MEVTKGTKTLPHRVTITHRSTMLCLNQFNRHRFVCLKLGRGTNNVNVPSNIGPYGRPDTSVRGWADYFPNARVFGADIDKNILFQTDRIRTFYCDQTHPKCVKDIWKHKSLLEPFHILIEDELHTMDANVCFLKTVSTNCIGVAVTLSRTLHATLWKNGKPKSQNGV